MKLYTEEQLIKAIKLAQECESDCGGVYFGYTETEIINEIIPIELPSEKEINDYANDNVESISFVNGAIWMRDRLKGVNDDE